MSYEIIEGMSRADVAFKVRGMDVGALFREGARALIAIMMENPESVRPSTIVEIRCEEENIELLYYEWLSEIIFHKDAERLILLPVSIEIHGNVNGCRLISLCAGEVIDRKRHLFSIDIKAVTLHGLSVMEEKGVWTATAVIDV